MKSAMLRNYAVVALVLLGACAQPPADETAEPHEGTMHKVGCRAGRPTMKTLKLQTPTPAGSWFAIAVSCPEDDERRFTIYCKGSPKLARVVGERGINVDCGDE